MRGKRKKEEEKLQKELLRSYVKHDPLQRWAYTEHALEACNYRQIYNFLQYLR